MKNFGAIMLIAGTAIGSGMLALPITLAKLGIIPSAFFMILVSILTYYSAVVNLELHLQYNGKRSLTLSKLAQHYGGSISEGIGFVSVNLLSIALMAVFIYAGASVTSRLIEYITNTEYNFFYISLFYSICAIIILSLPTKFTDYFNRLLFLSLLIVTSVLILGLSSNLDFSQSINHHHSFDPFLWSSALPIVFTSFGFQAGIPSMVDYCGKDAKNLKKVFFWGSIIPMIVYLTWTFVVLVAISEKNPDFYSKMLVTNIEVKELIEQLALGANWQYIKIIALWISFFAIFTSVIGVGMGFISSIEQQTKEHLGSFGNKIIYSAIAVLPAYIIAIKIPNAFIIVLGFAGMLLSVIAILLPIFLLRTVYSSEKKFHYSELQNGIIPSIVLLFGLIIVLSEITNIFFSVII